MFTILKKHQLISNWNYSTLNRTLMNLSTVSSGNEPYGVPLNYCLIGKNIYFHCALEGKKLNNIAHNPKVSFCVVGETTIQPEKFSTKFECCIALGTATEVTGEEKQLALEGLIRKYSRQFIAEGLEYIKKTKKNKSDKNCPRIIHRKSKKIKPGHICDVVSYCLNCDLRHLPCCGLRISQQAFIRSFSGSWLAA